MAGTRLNHEIWATCPKCGTEYDRRKWGDTCPSCDRETMKRINNGIMREETQRTYKTIRS